MSIYSIEFEKIYYSDEIGCFHIYEDILKTNNIEYALKSITKSNQSIIFTRNDNNTNTKLQSLKPCPGMLIKFSEGQKIKFFFV